VPPFWCLVRRDDRNLCALCQVTGWPLMRMTQQYAALAKVGVEGSNPFARSSPLPAKHSPPRSRPSKTPASRRFCGSSLGFQIRNDTENLSPNAVLSPELGGWPIYSTSFLSFIINVVANRPAREVRNPFACQPADTPQIQTFASPSSRGRKPSERRTTALLRLRRQRLCGHTQGHI
jgi:hypothetical protein